MPHAQPASLSPPMNRQQRRRAERAAKKAKARRGQADKPVSQTLQQAAQHHQASRLEEAERLYREALRAEPNDATALHLLGTLLNQIGRSEEALALLQKAAEQAPENPETLNNLGVVYSALGQADEAIRSYEAAIERRPDYADAHRNLGTARLQQSHFEDARRHLEKALSDDALDPNVLRQLGDASGLLGDLEQAADYFGKALSLQPDDPLLLRQMSITLTLARRYPEALVYLAKAIPANPDSRELQNHLELVLGESPPKSYMADLEQALIACFKSPFLIHKSLAPVAANQIRLKYLQQARVEKSGGASAESACTTRLHMDGILSDQLLLFLLNKSVNADPSFELFLTAIRRAVLFSAGQQPTLSGPALAFLAALASQCHHNSYVFFSGQDEEQMVDQLAVEIGVLLEGATEAAEVLETRLALFAMYRPLSTLPCRNRLENVPARNWSSEIRPLIEVTLLNRLEEARINPTIPSIAKIEDEVSRAVQAQYEENPYPQWIALPMVEPRCIVDILREQCPSLVSPDFLTGQIEVLIAGCGTGQHPISAARLYSNSQVTAVDLSRTSLAYATRMARRLGVKNIDFYQGDILKLGDLERQFPVIECAGVLHHMHEPEAGLAVLAKLLRPGGIMKLGLYSELARRWVITARARIAELGLTPSADNIRAFRRAILSGQELPGSNLTTFGDFYDLDSCRDLIFHVQEHRYTIPQLRKLLDGHSLRFIGFYFPRKATARHFVEMFPDPSSATDLDCWQKFEEANPSAFSSMYQFWCQKPLQASSNHS